MGYVHRSAAEPGTAVEVGGTAATVARLPLRAAGHEAARDKSA
jgi:hypothetical protein